MLPSRPVLSAEPKKIWLEVLAIWLIAIGLIIVFEVFSFIPFVKENLAGFAGLIFLLLPLEWLYRKKEKSSDYGITWAHLGKGIVLALILAAVSFPLYVPAYQWWFSEIIHKPMHDFALALPQDFWKEVVGHFVLVALPEEAFYRGYMQTRLDCVFKKRVRILGADVGWSVVVTAAFFAIGHLVEFSPQRLGTFFPGLVFGWMRARTKSIGGSVVFHALCNIWGRVMYYGF